MSARGTDADIFIDDADLRAIYDYVLNQKKKIPTTPGLADKINSFVSWYQQLSWWDLHVNMADTLAEAFRRRDEINVLENNVLPADWIPADMRDRPPGAASGLSAPVPPKEPWIPTKYKMAAVITGAAVVALVVVRKIMFPFG